MVSAAQFFERSMAGGYSADQIRDFLETVAKRDPKQKEALKLLDTATDTIAKEEKSSTSLGDVVGQAAKTAAGVAVPAALTYAAAGPIAGAIGGMGAEAAGALGAGEAMAGAEGAGAGLSQMLKNMNPKDLMNLWNTYQKQGAGATLAQFAQSQMKGQAGGAMGQPQQPTGLELPEEIRTIALRQLQQQGDPLQASQITAAEVLRGPPLRDLGRTIEQKAGKNLEDVVLDFLSGQVQGQDVDIGIAQAMPPQQSGGIRSMPDDQLMALMKQRGLL